MKLNRIRALLTVTIMMFVGIVIAWAESTGTISIYDVITTTGTGKIKFVGVNLMALGMFLSTILIPFIVAGIKKLVPQAMSIAWVPIVLGALLWISGGLIAGQITTWWTFIAYLVTGICSGGVASSARDIFKGK